MGANAYDDAHHVGFAVLNTDRDVFLKHGQHGPAVVSREDAERYVEGESPTNDHLTVVAVAEVR